MTNTTPPEPDCLRRAAIVGLQGVKMVLGGVGRVKMAWRWSMGLGLYFLIGLTFMNFLNAEVQCPGRDLNKRGARPALVVALGWPAFVATVLAFDWPQCASTPSGQRASSQ